MVDSVDLEAMLDANEANSAMNEVNAKLSDQLAVDLVSGEGPDIIMNGCAFSQLNNSDYLLDLAPYVEKLDTSGLYSNVIEAAKESDGKLYQIYFAPADGTGNTDIPVPANKVYDISGNNVDGFIVTVTMN